MSDLALLLGCFAKLRRIVVRQTTPENFKNFRSRFSSGANDEDAIELSARTRGYLPQEQVLCLRQRFQLYVAPRPTRQQTAAEQRPANENRQSADDCETLPSNRIPRDLSRLRHKQPIEQVHRGVVFELPFRVPTPLNHNKAIFLQRLCPAAKHSIARAPVLYVRSARFWRSTAPETQRPNCRPQPSDIAKWSECHQSAGLPRMPLFSPAG